MENDNWEIFNINDTVVKTKSFLATQYLNGDLYFASCDGEKNNVKIFKNCNVLKTLESDDENFGKFAKFYNQKLCIISNKCAYIYNLEDCELINKHEVDTEIKCVDFENNMVFIKSDDFVTFDINTMEKKKCDLIYDDFIVKYVNNTYYVASVIENNTKIIINSSNDLETWTKNKEYKFNSIKYVNFEFEEINNKLWMTVCDKLNVKLFQCDLKNNKWNHFYSILYHNENLLKQAISKYDVGGKFWTIVTDEKNNIFVFEKDDEMAQLNLKKQFANKNNIVIDSYIDDKLDLNIICENLLDEDTIKIGRFTEKDKEKIMNLIENYKNKEIDADDLKFDIIHGDNINLENKKKFSEYYKMILNLLNEALGNNKNKEEYNKFGYALKKYICDNFISQQNCSDINFTLMKHKKNAFFYLENNKIKTIDGKIYSLDSENYDIVTNLHIVGNLTCSIIKKDEKIKLCKWTNNGKNLEFAQNTSIYNTTSQELKMFHNNKNLIIENNNCFELDTCNKYQCANIDIDKTIKDFNFSSIKINKHQESKYNSNLLTIGYVATDNLADFPHEYDNLIFEDKERCLVVNFNGTNYFPNGEPDSNFKLKNINNILINFYSKKLSDVDTRDVENVMYLIFSNQVPLHTILYSEFKSSADVDDDEYVEWKSLNGNLIDITFLSFDLLFYNKTETNINITFDIAMFFESINFALNKKNILCGKILSNKKVLVKNIISNNDMEEQEIIDFIDKLTE